MSNPVLVAIVNRAMDALRDIALEATKALGAEAQSSFKFEKSIGAPMQVGMTTKPPVQASEESDASGGESQAASMFSDTKPVRGKNADALYMALTDQVNAGETVDPAQIARLPKARQEEFEAFLKSVASADADENVDEGSNLDASGDAADTPSDEASTDSVTLTVTLADGTVAHETNDADEWESVMCDMLESKCATADEMKKFLTANRPLIDSLGDTEQVLSVKDHARQAILKATKAAQSTNNISAEKKEKVDDTAVTGEVTKQMLAEKLPDLAVLNLKAAQDLLKKYDAKNISGIKTEDYANAYADIEARIAELKKG